MRSLVEAWADDARKAGERVDVADAYSVTDEGVAEDATMEIAQEQRQWESLLMGACARCVGAVQ